LRGKTAGLFRETEKFTDEERAKFEDWIKQTYYGDFVPKVAKGRNKDAQSIDAVGQGRVWTGAQAKDRGLVDDFGGLEKAIEVAKQLVSIPPDKGVERVILPYPQTFLQQLLNNSRENSNTKVEQQRAIAAVLPEDAKRALRYMALMDKMKNGETMMLLPFDLRVK
jgi:protease-4